ncbi:GvpL/GvpF family gas vesicle protein [Streptomyces somaliensis]|uniref:GvpL/GvpF family gas vesicle protein n=1 Tax=Streptomyces somaliensis TaxID=78355 RepID=UPI0020CE4248|nr:GvpL/GvpF family gas vesicle protein [Streptomyces somaliensis]MCP9946919.1 GvpL/GvpF family gas vesicle protein [Streptomyces somaliensis]MCP9963553.1 GvpL/GvpF family gas vesicle protein [Streptomyces somaliensis]MCP9976106.1 GvpL/GvpF family gas vesicle protein [Streptomyces somaliensis]
MSTYVYGITRSSHPALPEKADGVGDPPRPVRVLTHGGVAALVSDAPENLRPKRRDLLAHQGVLGAAGADGTVLPLRFGGVSPDDDAVLAVLREREEHYLERLERLDGKVEYNVKAVHDEQAVLHQVLADNPELRALSQEQRAAGGGTYEQKLALGERIAAAVKHREARDAVLVQESLEKAAAECRPGPEGTGRLANLSFLVERDRSGAFTDAVDALGKEHGHLVLQVTGPLPPYSFVE